MNSKAVLLFGASGAIGAGLLKNLLDEGRTVTAVTRGRSKQGDHRANWVSLDPFATEASLNLLNDHGPYGVVIWAQGINHKDSIYSFDLSSHMAVYQANTLYCLVTLHHLLQKGLLTNCTKLCVISSIWQRLARQEKLSYCVSKAALEGFVLSASVDLAKEGHLINAVLPGVLETPMTRRALTQDQLQHVTASTHFNRLSSIEDVLTAVHFFCSDANTSITGQCLAVDLGFSRARIV